MIRYANKTDIDNIKQYDNHITLDELLVSISLKRVLIIEENKKFIGWLRFNMFWDNTPFMNMLFILENYQRNGYGTKLVSFFENEMKKLNYQYVLTSTQRNESAKYFYNLLGYIEIGCFTLPNDGEEILFYKQI